MVCYSLVIHVLSWSCMARTSNRNPLTLTPEQRQRLQEVARSRTHPVRAVQRAHILLAYAERTPIADIARLFHTTRTTVYKCLDKALAMGWEAGLHDLYHRPKAPVITAEAKAWVVALACTKPKEQGLAAELWTQHALAQYVRRHAPQAGHACLARAAKATVHRILKAHPLQPHKVQYYLERRDPEFAKKMQEVLLVYQEVQMHNEQRKDQAGPHHLYTVSVDEKPGVQALSTTAPDLPPRPGSYPRVGRDYEYKRRGTASILAALDLHDGHVIAQVHRRHRSREFIQLLKELDAYYPATAQIRVILDNHSAHVSKETRTYLATRPNRFVYVHTPTHGSWLNLVETLFSKMARTFLRHIRVDSWEELRDRILKGIQEINAAPVVHRWKKFDLMQS